MTASTQENSNTAKLETAQISATMKDLKDTPMASWNVPYDQLTEEEKTWTQFIQGSAQHAGTT